MEFKYNKIESYLLKLKTPLGLTIYYRYHYGLHFVYDIDLNIVSRNETLDYLFNFGCTEMPMLKDECISILSKIDNCDYVEGTNKKSPIKINYVYDKCQGYFIVYKKCNYVRVIDLLFPTTGSANLYLQLNYNENEFHKFCLITYNDYARLMNELEE